MGPDNPYPSLRHVVEALGVVGGVELLNPESGPLPVGGPRLWDVSDPPHLELRDVVLAVNMTPVEGALATFRGSGITAVAFKGEVSRLLPEAQRLGIGLLAVADEMSWDQLYGFLQRAAATSGPTHDKDLFAFANALAALAGGAVTIEDRRGVLLAHSTLDQEIDEPRRQTILGRGHPQRWSKLLEEEGFNRLLARSAGPVRISDREGRAQERVVTLVQAGAEVLGSIWVVGGSVPLGADTEQILARATPQAAMHLLRLRSHGDLSRRDRGARLRNLLEGEPATDLGVDLSASLQLAAFHVSGPGGPDLVVNRAQVLDAIALAGEAFRRQVVCCWIEDTVYALFPDVSASTTDQVVALVADTCGRMSAALGIEVVAGLSDPGSGPGSIRRCREEADRALRVMIARPAGGRVGTVTDTRVNHTLLTLGDLIRSRPDLQLPGVQKLIRLDRERGKSYLETLRAYLDAAGSIPDAAASLGVHVNTMRYRLERAQEVSGLNLRDPLERLVVAIELLTLDS